MSPYFYHHQPNSANRKPSSFFWAFSLLLIGIYAFHSPDTTFHRYRISFDQAFVSTNNQVGNEWISYLQVGKVNLQLGESLLLELTNRAPIRLEAHAIEKDPVYHDIGSTVKVIDYSDFIGIEKTRMEMTVEVRENGGKYAGNLAVLKFLLRIERVKESK